MNPGAVTVNGVTYQPAACGGGACDPRGIGLNPIVNQIWSRYMPPPNDPQAGDQYNTQGYRSNLKLPQTSDFGVIRLDHDFGSRNHLMVSDRYYRYNQLTSNQVDIGGALPGNTFGQAAASAPRPQNANYIVAGLTTNITPALTNDFHFNFIRNYWSWSSVGGTPQLPGLGGAVEIGGETSNARSYTRHLRHASAFGTAMTRCTATTTRFMAITWSVRRFYQRNYDFYTRNDNGIAGTPRWSIRSATAAHHMPSYLPRDFRRTSSRTTEPAR